MIDFLLGVLLLACIAVACVIGIAVYLLAWGARRQKLIDAWENGHAAGLWDAGADAVVSWTPNPYLREHEQAHRGG